MTRSPTAGTGDSARPRWSVWGRRARARRPRASASGSATSATSRAGPTGFDPAYSMTAAIVGVDVGGTTTAAGVVTRDGDVVVDESAPTRGKAPADPLAAISALIRKVSDEAARRMRSIDAIGVGVPGPVDAGPCRVREPALHVPELAGRPLADELTAEFGPPAFVDNDVNALALGEWMFGAGRGARSLVVLAAGTGFGAGVVLEGRLVRGAAGFGGELGHAPVRFDGPRCWCGGGGGLAPFANRGGGGGSARGPGAGHAPASLLEAARGGPKRITAP